MSLESWTISQVSDWISSISSLHSQTFEENKIDGFVLSLATHEMLKEMQIEHQDRSLILNAVYQLRKQSGDLELELPISPGAYEAQSSSLLKKLEEREYIIKILSNQLAEIKQSNLNSQQQKLSKSQKSPTGTEPKATTPLSAKQEMIMKSVNEIYGTSGSSSAKAKAAWNFL